MKKRFKKNVFIPQINELLHINIPVMLMPDDFKAHSKIKVDNHLFNKWVYALFYLELCIHVYIIFYSHLFILKDVN